LELKGHILHAEETRISSEFKAQDNDVWRAWKKEKQEQKYLPRRASLRLKGHNLEWTSECEQKTEFWLSLRATPTLDFGPQKVQGFDSTVSSASPTV
jgi:hypothetical protein